MKLERTSEEEVNYLFRKILIKSVDLFFRGINTSIYVKYHGF